jgi:tetratricopeptide (TPR) repeat protein
MLWNKAAAAYGNKDYRDAYDKLAEAHYLRPTDNEILRQMVICAEKYGGIERAIRCLEKLKTGDDSPEVAAEYERLYAIYNNLLKEHREQAETKPRSAVNTSKKKKKKR